MDKQFARLPGIFLISMATCIVMQGQHLPIRYEPVGNMEDYSFIQTLCLYQDTRGLLWFGTQRGLDRWDGSRVVSYPYTPFDSLALPMGEVRCITGDDQKNLWLLGDGLLRFDLENESFTQVNLAIDGTELNPTFVRYDQSGFLWVGSAQGFFKYFPGSDSLCQIRVEDRESEASEPSTYDLRAMEKDYTGKLWVIDHLQGLYYYSDPSDSFRKVAINPQQNPGEGMSFADLSIGPDGSLWILGDKYELTRFNPFTGSAEEVCKKMTASLSPTLTGGIEVDRNGKVWFGIDKGLVLYDPVTKKISQLDPKEDPAMIMDILEDHQGNIVLATIEGVRIADLEGSNIISVPLKEQLLKDGVEWITNIEREDHAYWIGTFSSGMIRYDPNLQGIRFYRAFDHPDSLSSNTIFKILRDNDGRMWVMAGREGTLHRYDPQNDRFVRLNIRISRFIVKDEEGFFWICGLDRLFRLDPITLDTASFPFNVPLPLHELRGELDLIPWIVDRNGIFWFGQQDGGLYRIDPGSGNWIHFSFDKNNPEGLPDQHVKTLFCDSKGNVWLSTRIGLSRIIQHPGSDTAISFCNDYIKDPRLRNPIRIAEDHKGNLWIGTFTGLDILRPDGSVERYTYRDGLPDSPRMINALNSNADGSMCLGTADLVILPPGFLEFNETIPPIMLTELWIDDQPVTPGKGSPLERSMLFADRVDLKHDQNFIRVDFAALNLTHPQRNQYRYILEGVDYDTVYAGNASYAEYTDLSPGNYRFWVTGSNNTGLWNPQGKSIMVRVRPPWHRSGAAWAAYFVLLIAILNRYLGVRTARLKKEKLRLEQEVGQRTAEIREKNGKILELDQMKTLFFNNISHELRTLLTAVKTPLESIMEEENISRTGRRGTEVLYRNFNRLMLLVNQLLDISKIDSGRMKLVLCRQNVYDFVRQIAVSYASLAESKGVYFRYYLPARETLEWFDADKIEKVISNLLANAFKFTSEGGKVELLVIHKAPYNGMGNVLEINVSDSGIGISEEEQLKVFDRFYQVESNLKKRGEGTGIGLALAHDLVELMHGTIKVQSEVGKGSTFSVHIPLGKDHLEEAEFQLCEAAMVDKKEMPENFPDYIRDDNQQVENALHEPGSRSKPLMLVVEDNPDILWLISDGMKPAFNVLEAIDGRAGLKLATENLPDVVVTDLMMPRMDGFELCQTLKNDIRTSHIPVIMLTAKTTTADRMQGLKIMADDYITKPFEMKEVLVRSRNLVEQRRMLREKYKQEITLDPRDVVVSSVDERFLGRVMEMINNHMGDEDFAVSALCKELNMSRSTLFRKLDALTGHSPVEFIRIMRLKRAAYLFQRNFGNVSEVALEVGFSNPSYFTRMFKKTFSATPSDYIKSVGRNQSGPPA